jgi:dihydroorotate dehydrogenase (fumarate)
MSVLSMLRIENPWKKVTVRLVAVGLAVMTAFSGSLAIAEETLSISAAPAANGAIDESRSSFSFQLEPGQSVADEYFVQNSGNVDQTISVYATDAFNSENGDFALLDTSDAPTDVGSWITFDGGLPRVDFTLKAGQSKIVGFSLAVPAEASPGDHAGGIVVSAQSEAGQVTLDRRVATRLYARIKGELVAQLSIGSLEALYDGEFFNPFGGTATITATVSNTGNVSLGADVVAGVNGIFGIPIAQAPAIEVPELLPGTTRTYTFEVTGVGAWVYLNPYVKLVGTIDPDALDPGELPSLERGVTLFVVPWHFLLLLVIVGVLMIQLRSRARINEQREKEWVAYAAAQAAQEKQDSK